MTSTGPPPKPWEVSSADTPVSKPWESSVSPQTTSTSNEEKEETKRQITSPYTPYSRPYSNPYQSSYGSGYYGYPSSYSTGYSGYGSNYGGYFGNNFGSPYGGSYYRSTQWMPPGTAPGIGYPNDDRPRSMPMWQKFLEGLHKVVNCFGRVTFLVDENAQAFHFFITALLAFLDKAGSLYGEVFRFVMKLLGIGKSSISKSLSPNKRQLFKTLWKK